MELEIDGDTTNEIELPQTANIGDILTYDGANWIAKRLYDLSHSNSTTTSNNSIVSVGNLQIRFNGSSNGGFLECKTISGSFQGMVFMKRSTGSWSLQGNSSTENFRNNSNYNSTNWSPMIRLWDGNGWNDDVIISTYGSIDAYIYDMGNNGNPVTNNFIYSIKTSIDGYGNVLIYADVKKD